MALLVSRVQLWHPTCLLCHVCCCRAPLGILPLGIWQVRGPHPAGAKPRVQAKPHIAVDLLVLAHLTCSLGLAEPQTDLSPEAWGEWLLLACNQTHSKNQSHTTVCPAALVCEAQTTGPCPCGIRYSHKAHKLIVSAMSGHHPLGPLMHKPKGTLCRQDTVACSCFADSVFCKGCTPWACSEVAEQFGPQRLQAHLNWAPVTRSLIITTVASLCCCVHCRLWNQHRTECCHGCTICADWQGDACWSDDGGWLCRGDVQLGQVEGVDGCMSWGAIPVHEAWGSWQ